jgi:antibiotic biosynthesis monooxygenase (ABM) superfamily enzyme
MERWSTPAFWKANQFVSLIWGGCFLVCLILSLARGLGVWHILLPAVLLIETAILTPRLSVWYAKQVVNHGDARK